MKFLYVIDLDGVLVDTSKRFELALRDDDSINWEIAFDQNHIPLDTPIETAVEALRGLTDDCERIYLTSRPEYLRAATERWLRLHNLWGPELVMKNYDIYRFMKTTVWKHMKVEELQNNHKCTILFIDDEEKNRKCVGELNGVQCFETLQDAQLWIGGQNA